MQSILPILVVSFMLFLANKGYTQQNSNKLDPIKGVVQVKFKPDRTTNLQRMLLNRSNGKGKLNRSQKQDYVETGFRGVDQQNRNYRVTTMKRVFRPAGKFEEKHIAFGLHLWYEIEFDENQDLNQVIEAYRKLDEIEKASYVYKTHIEGTTKSTLKPTNLRKHQKTSLNKMDFSGAPNDPRYTDQWHYNNTGQEEGIVGSDIKLEQAWNIEKGDARVIVAVGDELIDPTHPDLEGNMWVNPGEIPGNNIDDDNNGYVDDIHGYDFVNNTGTLSPTSSHGTHVGGTIAAETNNGIGVAGVAGGSGSNDGVRLMSCGIIGPGSNAEYFVYAADNGAVISQNSWSGGSPQDATPIKEAIDYFITNAGGAGKAMNGGLVVFSMGNNNSEFFDSYKASEKILRVVATNNKDERASYSNYHVDASIAAPGGEDQSGVISTVLNDNYGASRGTSMATPHVSGVAALIVSKAYGTVNADEVRSILTGTTDFIDYRSPSYAGKLGTGRLNAYQALRVAENKNIPIAVRASNITENSALINWESLTQQTSFDLRYKKSSETSWTTITVTGTSKQLTNLEDGEWYDVQVKTNGGAAYSSTTTFITKPSLFSAPVLVASTIGETKLDLSWNNVKGAVTYELRYKVKNENTWLSIESNLGTTITLEDLYPNTVYEVQIRSVNTDLYSSYSSSLEVRTTFTSCGEVQPWEPRTYTGSGTKVSYEGNIYSNRWHAEKNHVPSKHNVWSKIGVCNPDANQPPTVTITQPTNGQVIEQETLSAITLSANANDPDGTIASVQFEANGVTLTQGNNISWLPTAFGTYTIKVTVTDNRGATATHQVDITIRQVSNNQSPTVSITQPSDGQIIEQETLSTITLSANANDPDGTIASVQFEANGTTLTQGNNISWLPTAFGDYTIKVMVTDDKGATATDQVNITIRQTSSNQSPTVSITQPSNGQVIEQETLSAITLSANANDPDGTIVSLQFEANSVILTSGNNISWLPTAFRTYTIKVIVTDDKGATATDQVDITIRQTSSNQPPTVSITQPTNGQVIEQETLSAITLSANANDPDGTISSIQFEANGVTLTSGNNISWLPAAFGDYTISVTVVDDKGATVSDLVSITIKETNSGNCNGIAPWDPGRIYPSTGGVKVSHNGSIYENKWWTQNNEPGTGGPWGPWKLIGPCRNANAKAYTDLLSGETGSFIVGTKENHVEVLFYQKQKGSFKFSLYSLDGKYIDQLTSGYVPKGPHILNMSTVGVSNGIYLIKLEQNGVYQSIQKVIIRE